VNDITMLLPVVKAVPEGGFARWMAARGKVGGQNKVPLMDNDGRMSAEIAEWMAKNGG